MKSNPTMRVVLTLKSRIKITLVVACALLGGAVMAEQFGVNLRPVVAAGNFQDRSQQKIAPVKETTPVAAP